MLVWLWLLRERCDWICVSTCTSWERSTIENEQEYGEPGMQSPKQKTLAISPGGEVRLHRNSFQSIYNKNHIIKEPHTAIQMCLYFTGVTSVVLSDSLCSVLAIWETLRYLGKQVSPGVDSIYWPVSHCLFQGLLSEFVSCPKSYHPRNAHELRHLKTSF